MYVFGRFIHTTSTNELFVIIPTSCNPDPPMRPSVHRGPHVSSLHGWMEEEGQEIQLGKGHQRKGKDWYHLLTRTILCRDHKAPKKWSELILSGMCVSEFLALDDVLKSRPLTSHMYVLCSESKVSDFLVAGSTQH